MSLNRVASMESWEIGRGTSPARSHRKMSLNPVETWAPPAAHKNPLAFEIPELRRILQVAVAVLYCLLAAGVVFGYAALKPVLVREGVYRDLCTDEDWSGRREGEVRTCYEQELRLNLMFTIAAVATNVCALPVGTILDYYGPRISGTIGSVLLATGALFLSFAAQLPFDGYIPGYLFLALGGPFVFISSFQLSNAFPNHSGLILALLNGAFDSSSAVFLAYRLLYTASNGAFTPKKFFLIHLIIPVFILVVQVLIMPKESYKNVGELVAEVEADNAHPENPTPSPPLTTDREREREERRLRQESVLSETTSLLGTKSSNQHQPKRHEQEKKKKKKKQQTSSFQGVLHGRPALEQIRSPWFILITLFTTVQVTRINYFVATIRPQYEYLLHDYGAAEAVNNLFDMPSPSAASSASPSSASSSTTPAPPSSSPSSSRSPPPSASSASSLTSGLPTRTSPSSSFIDLFTIPPSHSEGGKSDYAAKTFGFQTFGKVYGLIVCLAGLGNVSHSALDLLTHRVFGHDPGPVNVGLLLAAAGVGAVLVGFVGWKGSGREGVGERVEVEVEVEAGGVRVREVRMPVVVVVEGEGDAGGEGSGI